MKLDPGLKQCEPGPDFSLSISLFSIFKIDFSLGPALLSLWSQNGANHSLPLDSKSETTFLLVGLGWITGKRINWMRGTEAHVPPPLAHGLRERENHSPPNKMRVWLIETMFSTDTQGPGTQITSSSTVFYLTKKFWLYPKDSVQVLPAEGKKLMANERLWHKTF